MHLHRIAKKKENRIEWKRGDYGVLRGCTSTAMSQSGHPRRTRAPVAELHRRRDCTTGSGLQCKSLKMVPATPFELESGRSE